MQEREQVALDRFGVDNPRLRHRPQGEPGQELAQERRLEVGGDSQALGHAEAKIGFDVAVRHHHGKRREGALALTLGTDGAHERIQEHLGAVGCDDANHEAQDTARH